jgi:hypothetical protein
VSQPAVPESAHGASRRDAAPYLVAALAWRLADQYDGVTSRDIHDALPAYVSAQHPVEQTLLRAREDGVLSRERDVWSAMDLSDEEVTCYRPTTTRTPGLYWAGDGLLFAIPPPTIPATILEVLARSPGLTSSALHQRLTSMGWSDIRLPTLDLVLLHWCQVTWDFGAWTPNRGAQRLRLPLSHSADWRPIHREVYGRPADAVSAQPARPPSLRSPTTAYPAVTSKVANVLPDPSAPQRHPSRHQDVSPTRSGRTSSRRSRVDADAVLITKAGQAYHLDENCPALRMGWAKAFDDGKRPTGLHAVPVSEAHTMGRHPCRSCTNG